MLRFDTLLIKNWTFFLISTDLLGWQLRFVATFTFKGNGAINQLLWRPLRTCDWHPGDRRKLTRLFGKFLCSYIVGGSLESPCRVQIGPHIQLPFTGLLYIVAGTEQWKMWNSDCLSLSSPLGSPLTIPLVGYPHFS